MHHKLYRVEMDTMPQVAKNTGKRCSKHLAFRPKNKNQDDILL